jgi:uncharacterized membrane protein
LTSDHSWADIMLASFLMGLIGGQRSMTPLAAVSVAAATGLLRSDMEGHRLLANPIVVTTTIALAAAELAGDKMKTAPDRIVPIGLAARFASTAIAGAALAPPGDRWLGAAVGGVTAVAASYPGWRARIATMPRWGQTRTGLVEDALVVVGAAMLVGLLGGAASGRGR